MSDTVHPKACGFFDPMSAYTAEIFNLPFKRLISNGVYSAEDGDVSTDLKTVKATGMNVTVMAGKGFFADHWFTLDSNDVFQVPDADLVNSRIDSIFVQVDLNNNCGNLVYRTGTPAEQPVQPAHDEVTGIHEFRIANILVNPSALSISDDDITDLRGTAECPWIKSLIADSFAKIVNVTQKGVRNDGTATNLSLAFSGTQSNVVYYFPKGTYKVGKFKFSNCENVTIFAPDALFVYDKVFNDKLTAFFNFENCTNCKVIGGVYDGGGEEGEECLQHGISLNSSKFCVVRDLEIKNVGNQSTAAAAGVSLIGDCSNSQIKNVKIHDIQAGVYSGNYIFASGISIVMSSTSLAFSQNVVIENPCIFDIGTAQYTGGSNNQSLKIDGDGIYIIQRPGYYSVKEEPTDYENNYYNSITDLSDDKEYYLYYDTSYGVETRRFFVEVKNGVKSWAVQYYKEKESFIKIINPVISDCSKRAVKVSTRCVDIIGGVIDVNSESPAVEYQFSRNSTIRDLYIRNNNATCLTLCGGDGMMNIENCYFYGNRTNKGIVLYEENGSTPRVNIGGENVVISGCDFENLLTPIVADINSGDAVPVVSESITIRDCSIGYFTGDTAIKMVPRRFSSLKKLKICDIRFKNGNTISDIIAENNRYYGLSVTSNNLINLGTPGNHINPSLSLIIDIDTLEEDFNTLFSSYLFWTKNLFFGGVPALASEVFETPEYAKLTIGGDYTSNSDAEADLRATILPGSVIKVTGTSKSFIQYVYIPIEGSFTALAGEEYEIKVHTNAVYPNTGMTIGMFSTATGGNRVGSEISLNGTTKRIAFTPSVDVTAVAIGIKLPSGIDVISPVEGEGTQINFSVTPKKRFIKGMTEIQNILASLDSRVAALEENN